MTSDIRERLELQSVGQIVELYELDATRLGGSLYRFCNSAVENDFVRFGGEAYAPVAFEADGWSVSGQGSIPRPSVRIESSPTILAAIVSLNNLQGAEVRRIRTLRQYLDDGETPDAGQQLPQDVYIVNRVVSRDITGIEFELVPILDQDGKQVPSQQCFRNVCSRLRYRVYSPTAPEEDPFDYTTATCPYVGAVYVDKLGEPTTDPQKDKCGKRLSDCKKRFGSTAELPFGGFPGMIRI